MNYNGMDSIRHGGQKFCEPEDARPVDHRTAETPRADILDHRIRELTCRIMDAKRQMEEVALELIEVRHEVRHELDQKQIEKIEIQVDPKIAEF